MPLTGATPRALSRRETSRSSERWPSSDGADRGLTHFRSDEFPMGHHCRRETPRTGPWWKTSRESGASVRKHPTRSFGKALECRVPPLSRGGAQSAGGKGSGSRSHDERGTLWRGAKRPGEHRLPTGSRRGGVRISAGSNALEPRGIVIFWSSEQEHAMPGTAGGQGCREARGSAEGKRSAGRTPRVAPILEIGRRWRE